MIGTTFGSNHSWKKYRLIQNGFKVGSPEVKTHYIDVPGRQDGPLDATESIAGRVLYGMRQLEFQYEIPGWFDPKEKWNQIAADIHGKRLTIVSDHLREYRFTGRCSVGSLGRTTGTARAFTVSCVCDPEITQTSDRILERITAIYSGGSVYEGTDPRSLNIMVTGFYSDGTSQSISGYSVSGSIGVGTNIITVSYQGARTTVSVTGTARPVTTTYFTLGQSKLNSADILR